LILAMALSVPVLGCGPEATSDGKSASVGSSHEALTLPSEPTFVKSEDSTETQMKPAASSTTSASSKLAGRAVTPNDSIFVHPLGSMNVWHTVYWGACEYEIKFGNAYGGAYA